MHKQLTINLTFDFEQRRWRRCSKTNEYSRDVTGHTYLLWPDKAKTGFEYNHLNLRLSTNRPIIGSAKICKAGLPSRCVRDSRKRSNASQDFGYVEPIWIIY